MPRALDRLAERAPLASALAALLFSLPALFIGFYNDDFAHLLSLRGAISDTSVADLYRYTGGAERAGAVQGTFMPWWTESDARLVMFRPVASLSLALDHAAFGLTPWPWHAVNVVLFVLLALSMTTVYRTAGLRSDRPALVALIAGLFFALDSAHVLPVAWVANRHVLFAALATLGAVLCRHRAASGGRHWWLASAALVAVAVASSELGVGALGWLLAYELGFATGSARQRWSRLALPAAVVLAYLFATRALGYGASGISYYIDPRRDPLGALGGTFFGRLGLLLSGLTSALPSDFGAAKGGALGGASVAFGFAALAALIGVSWRTLRQDPWARTACLGALLSLVPLATSHPSDRLLMLPSLGSAWWFACVVHDGARRQASPLLGLAALALLCMHGVADPILGQRFGRQFAERAAENTRFALEADLPAGPGARVLFLDAPEAASIGLPLALRALRAREAVAAAWQLSLAPGQQEIRRVSPTSFELSARVGLLSRPVERQCCRDEARPIRAGFESRTGVLRVRVMEVQGGLVTRLEAEIDRPLDDAGVVLLGWDGRRYTRLEAPPVGGSLRLGARAQAPAASQ